MVVPEEKQALLEDVRDHGIDGRQDTHQYAKWRRLMSGVVHAIVLSSTAFALWFLITRNGSPMHNATIEQRVDNILSTTPLFDGHNDLPILIRAMYENHIYNSDFVEKFTHGGLFGHVDLPRLRKGKIGGTFWSVYVPCPANWSDFSDETYAASVRQTYEQVDLVSRLQQQFPDVFSEPGNSSTAMEYFRQGKIISPYGIEGLHSIGNSFAHLRAFHQLGVRYATLTHNCHNSFADAALVQTLHGVQKAEPLWHGVSEKGKKVVYEMNRLGMLVDLSHVSQDTMRDVLGAGKDGWPGSQAPVIFSHSSSYAVCPHPRNPPDDILQLVKRTGSLVMVNFSPSFISCTAGDNENGLPDFYPPNATLSQVVDHIVHVGELIGYEHVGFGSDFDGIPSTPEGLNDVSKYPDLVAELLRRGISDEDVARVVGGNLLRVWAQVDAVAARLQAEGALPVEDDLDDSLQAVY